MKSLLVWPELELFTPVVPASRQHPSFTTVATVPGHQAARVVMQQIADRLDDVDGNFVEQFQTTGFDARVWELYLFAALEDLGLRVRRPRPSPDFECTAGEAKFFVEAVTANPADTKSAPKPSPPSSREQWFQALRNSQDDFDWHAVRLGSALFSKLRKGYSDLPAVRGHPLVLAIESFADIGALTQSEVPLMRYLFGRELVKRRGPVDAVASERALAEHTAAGKTIPSGFFFQPGAEDLSAVLFSNEGTIGKFDRMGLQAGLGDPNVRSWRIGLRHNPDRSATAPLEFSYEVGEVVERWSDGLVFIHNPNARYPLDPGLVPGVVHHLDVDGTIVSMGPPFQVFSSFTFTVRTGGGAAS